MMNSVRLTSYYQSYLNVAEGEPKIGIISSIELRDNCKAVPKVTTSANPRTKERIGTRCTFYFSTGARLNAGPHRRT